MLNNIKDPLILEKIIEVLTHSVEIATAGQGQSQVEVSQSKSYAQSNMRRIPPKWKEENEREKRFMERNRIREIKKRYWENRNLQDNKNRRKNISLTEHYGRSENTDLEL